MLDGQFRFNDVDTTDGEEGTYHYAEAMSDEILRQAGRPIYNEVKNNDD